MRQTYVSNWIHYVLSKYSTKIPKIFPVFFGIYQVDSLHFHFWLNTVGLIDLSPNCYILILSLVSWCKQLTSLKIQFLSWIRKKEWIANFVLSNRLRQWKNRSTKCECDPWRKTRLLKNKTKLVSHTINPLNSSCRLFCAFDNHFCLYNVCSFIKYFHFILLRLKSKICALSGIVALCVCDN